MIMTYLAVLLYPLVYKVKTALVEIIYGRGKFVGDFNMGTLKECGLTQYEKP